MIPIEIRDFIYGRLIEQSPATLYPGALIKLRLLKYRPSCPITQ
jgi:hypothetical protein